jgi:hypothetical protein
MTYVACGAIGRRWGVLSRELCEPLAAVYGYRQIQYGDWFYQGDEKTPTVFVPGATSLANAGFVPCPRLDQLLELATHATGRTVCLIYSRSPLGVTEARAWASDQDPVAAIVAGSPEEAVARWLLAAAKERGDRGHPS